MLSAIKELLSRFSPNIVEEGHVFRAYEPIQSKLTALIPERIMKLIKEEEKRRGHNEFAILFRGRWTKEGFLLTEHYIPEQETSPVRVKILEDTIELRDKGYIAVLHRHPPGCKHFSATDYSYVNSNFPVSILYVDGGISEVTFLVKAGPDFIIVKGDAKIVQV